ncbi:hypothetical protein GCM10010377_16280 [Streptomyces viridiviolaceus]|uniref:Secreted protein n=1 Tax=Streptomyces viridiviolaceus TaxID=68282 RepID=A0ABW2DWL7_9ACTN|nr:hypothetical protein [Streptomyces viridiviolaceus]GHB27042.1 hypothetical protein GCM10010377_16280 [Streptomyces viridiviolaceus]
MGAASAMLVVVPWSLLREATDLRTERAAVVRSRHRVVADGNTTAPVTTAKAPAIVCRRARRSAPRTCQAGAGSSSARRRRRALVGVGTGHGTGAPAQGQVGGGLRLCAHLPAAALLEACRAVAPVRLDGRAAPARLT